MSAATAAASVSPGVLPHVLMVSNHWKEQKTFPFANIFMDRQIASLKDAGVRVSTFDIETNHSPFHIVRKWFELRRQVRLLSPDIIHAQYGTIVGFLAAFAGPPVVISFCGGDLLTGASVSRLRTYLGILLSNLASLRARGIICKSEELRRALWWRRNRAIVIPNGVDLDLFSPGPREAARQELGWNHRHPVLLLNKGSDPKRKGLDLAEAAMKVVRARIPDAELHVVGEVSPDRLPLYYRAADVLLCLSIMEGSPNVVKEALACNLPVVSTPVGDVPERLSGVHPSAVVPRDANAIGQAITQVLMARQRSNGREHVSSLGQDQVAERVLQVYRAALGKSSLDARVVDRPLAEEVTIVPIKDGGMLHAVARVHLEAFAGYPNILLGSGYTKAFIKWFTEKENAIAIAAVDSSKNVIGYAIGAAVGYERALNRELFWLVATRILIRPWVLLNPLLWMIMAARLRSLLGYSQARQEFELPKPTMSLVAIGVASSQRRRGVGLRLMQAFDEKAGQLQTRSLILSVYLDNPVARRFYETCGWQLTGQVIEGGVTQYCRVLRSGCASNTENSALISITDEQIPV